MGTEGEWGWHQNNPKNCQSELGLNFKNIEICLEFLHLIQTLQTAFHQSQTSQCCLNLGFCILDWLQKLTMSST